MGGRGATLSLWGRCGRKQEEEKESGDLSQLSISHGMQLMSHDSYPIIAHNDFHNSSNYG